MITLHKRRVSFSWRSLPFAVFLLLILAFGLLIPWLGFYFDDWPVILIAQLQGANGFWEFYQYDRPFSAWTYILTTPLLGVSSLPWHILTLLMRWSAVLGMAWCLGNLWPERTRRNAWSLASMVLLFAIYPAFDQQPIAVAYNQHWISYALYFFSLGAMIQSVRRPRWFWLLTLLSLASATLHLLTMEYFFGLELLRPMVLWMLLKWEGEPVEPGGDRRKAIGIWANSRLLGRKAGEEDSARSTSPQSTRLVRVLLFWIPYLLLAIAYGFWRLFLLELPIEDPNRPELLYNIAHEPLAVLLQVLQFALRDLVNILFGAWYRAIDPLQINLSDRFVVFSWLLAAFVSVIMGFYLRHIDGTKLEERAVSQPLSTEPPSRELLWFGLAALLLGLLPVWMTGRYSLHGLYGGRFALAGLFGASILWIGMIEELSDRRGASLILVSVLVGLSVAFHLQRANEFRWYWQDQVRFYWQLSWRAPHLEPGTAVLSDGEFLQYVGRYSTSAALNLLYPQPAGQEDFAYWFLEVTPGYLTQNEQTPQGHELETGFRSFTFSSSTAHSIVISYQPDTGRCMWLLSPQDADNPELTELTRDAVELSDLTLILPEPVSSGFPPEAIFGREPAHGWCYYYQKAELARQLGEWEQASRLGDEAQDLGYEPNHALEWLPFIEAYAHTGRWEKALEWTRQVLRIDRKFAPKVCNLWERIASEVSLPAEVESTFGELTEEYDQCIDE
jgi:hypothetical protein